MRNYNPRKRILVTGGAGFLGSHLTDRLLERGDEVVCADNLFTGTKRNIEHLHDQPRFEFIRHDVTFPLYIEVDEIWNLACPASPIHYQHDPVQTTKTSVHGAINMLGLAKRLKCRIFQASTSEVYGDPSVHPQTEAYWGNVNPIGPRSCPPTTRCSASRTSPARRLRALTICTSLAMPLRCRSEQVRHAAGKLSRTRRKPGACGLRFKTRAVACPLGGGRCVAVQHLVAYFALDQGLVGKQRFSEIFKARPVPLAAKHVKPSQILGFLVPRRGIGATLATFPREYLP
jgi:hypothetical protein